MAVPGCHYQDQLDGKLKSTLFLNSKLGVKKGSVISSQKSYGAGFGGKKPHNNMRRSRYLSRQEALEFNFLTMGPVSF